MKEDEKIKMLEREIELLREIVDLQRRTMYPLYPSVSIPHVTTVQDDPYTYPYTTTTISCGTGVCMTSGSGI